MKRVILCLALLVSYFSNAQVPKGINYQAVIRNINGTIVNNSLVGLRMRIIQGASTGAPIYVESFTETTSNIGLVNVVLGQGTVIAGSFSTIDWSSGPYFLEIAADANGGTNYTVMGTQQMMSVPYALYAENSATPGPQGATGPQGPAGLDGANGQNGLSAYQSWLALGNMGTEADFIASLTGPQGIQGVTGSVGPTGPQGPSGLLVNGSVAGNTPYWNGTQWVINGANFFNNGGSIGIGTTIPNSSAILDINSSTQGMLAPRMTTQQRNSIINPVDGLIIFNTSSGCLNYYYSNTWFKLCGLEPVAPAAPQFISSNPVSPSNSSTSPTILLNSSEGNTIELYANGTCSGLPVASGIVGLGGTISIPVSVSENSTTVFSAKATDTEANVSSCSTVFAYTHDIIPPTSITISSSTPVSPSSVSTSPTINLTGGEPGSTVKIYKTSNCSGIVAATGIIGAGGTASIPVVVSANSTTQLTATTTDAAGNVSNCSNVFSYTHDNIPPSTPVIVSSNPASPSNTLTPTLNLSGSAFATFSIYSNGSGTGIPIATGTFNASGLASIVVSVISNSTTTFTAKSTDSAGNLSALSSSFFYTHVP
jgi:hypothetical protein